MAAQKKYWKCSHAVYSLVTIFRFKLRILRWHWFAILNKIIRILTNSITIIISNMSLKIVAKLHYIATFLKRQMHLSHYFTWTYFSLTNIFVNLIFLYIIIWIVYVYYILVSKTKIMNLYTVVSFFSQTFWV